MLTYEEAVAYLHSLQRFGMKPGLDRTEELLRRLGRPDRRAGRIVHITGTSGKGSVAAMVESSLRAAGHRVGLYISPALERFTERIQVDRVEISPDDVAALTTAVQPHVNAMVAEGCDQPTEFEVTTAIAFLYFAERQVDWLVLEVGLGGRFDATTAADNPFITCITNIGLDHTQWLGDTHVKIAYDKAGIIKPAVPCVTGTTHPEALEVIRQVAISNDSVLVEVTPHDVEVTSIGPEGQVVRILGARGWYEGVSLSLLGRHQADNAAVAVRVLELAGVPVEAIRKGLAAVRWPGRFELIELPNAIVVFDAAHNPAKCEALAEAMGQYFPGRAVNLVLGVLSDKDSAAMLPPLLALARQTWATEPDNPRRMSAQALAALCPGAIVEPSIEKAVRAAVDTGGLVLVTGSFYIVGPARKFLLAANWDENN